MCLLHRDEQERKRQCAEILKIRNSFVGRVENRVFDNAVRATTFSYSLDIQSHIFTNICRPVFYIYYFWSQNESIHLHFCMQQHIVANWINSKYVYRNLDGDLHSLRATTNHQKKHTPLTKPSPLRAHFHQGRKTLKRVATSNHQK